jgi:hypothetical protein
LQDFGIYRIGCCKLNRVLTMDRVEGLQDLKDLKNEGEKQKLVP